MERKGLYIERRSSYDRIVKMAKSFSPLETSKHLHNVSELYLKGLKQWEIARETGISAASVSRCLQLVQAEWRTARIDNINEIKMREVQRIDVLEREYWDAWKKSQQDKIITKSRSGTIGLNGINENSETIEGQVGDPRFLQGIQWCVDKRCEILGINNTAKNESSSIVVKSIVIQLPSNIQHAISGAVPESLPILESKEDQSIEGKFSEA